MRVVCRGGRPAGEGRATTSGERSDGGAQHRRRTESGRPGSPAEVELFARAETAARAAESRAAAAGSLYGHTRPAGDRCTRRPAAAAPFGASSGFVDRGLPLLQLASSHPVPEAGQRGQRVHVRRGLQRRVDDRRVGQHPAERDVPVPGHPVPGPARARAPPRSAAPRTVHGGGARPGSKPGCGRSGRIAACAAELAQPRQSTPGRSSSSQTASRRSGGARALAGPDRVAGPGHLAGRVLTDTAIINAALETRRTCTRWPRCRLRARMGRRQLEQWQAAVDKARTMPERELPQPAAAYTGPPRRVPGPTRTRPPPPGSPRPRRRSRPRRRASTSRRRTWSPRTRSAACAGPPSDPPPKWSPRPHRLGAAPGRPPHPPSSQVPPHRPPADPVE